MKVCFGSAESEIQSETQLEECLRWRDSVGGAEFWLGPDKYPHMGIRVGGQLADVCYFPEEGHPGFRCLAREAGDSQTVTLLFEGADPSAGEEIPSEFAIEFERALNVAKEFLATKALPRQEQWLEL